MSKEYASAALLVQLASVVAASDGDFAEPEQTLLVDHVERQLKLAPIEKKRLAARIRTYENQPPGMAGLKKRVSELDRIAREAIGDFLVLVVHADGIVKADEVRVMEKLWKLLDLEQSGLYGRLHGSEEHHSARPVSTTSSGTDRTPLHSKVLDLDPDKVAALIVETSKISEKLGAIYAAAEPAALLVPEKETEPALPRILNLDSEHHGLLLVLRQRSLWERSELEELCKNRGLMVDGAIERINEASFERFDQPLIEENEKIEIHSELIEELAV